MKIIQRTFILTVSYLFFAVCFLHAAQAKSVILMIGDGMGPAIVGISKNYNDFVLRKPTLNIEQLMNEGRTGIVITYSQSHLVTDSAAGGTAYACGIKTYNGAIGVDEKGKPVESILEKAKKTGKSVGLVTTCTLADATPAAFYAHVSRRAQQDEIAKQAIENGKVSLLLGGGSQIFDLDSAQKNGYKILHDKKELETYRKKISSETGQEIPLFLGVFSEKDLPYVKERSQDDPSLPEMTRFAIDVLKKNQKNGFFLMVEAGRIDHAGHKNSAEKMIKEFLELDETVGIVMEYQKRNPDTLVLLTADHDTGGIALSKQNGEEYPTRDQLAHFEKIYWISNNHTGSPVFLSGKGPGEEQVNGLHENVDVFKIMKESMGLP